MISSNVADKSFENLTDMFLSRCEYLCKFYFANFINIDEICSKDTRTSLTSRFYRYLLIKLIYRTLILQRIEQLFLKIEFQLWSFWCISEFRYGYLPNGYLPNDYRGWNFSKRSYSWAYGPNRDLFLEISQHQCPIYMLCNFELIFYRASHNS